MFEKYFMLILCALNINSGQRCRLQSRTHFSEPLPILIRNGNLLEPNDGFGNVVLENGETLLMSCEGGGSIYHPNAVNKLATATVSCYGEDLFKNDDWLNSASRFSEFSCEMPPSYSSRRANRTCFDRNMIYEVGYSVQSEFYPVYESCFNEGILNALYSKYTQKPFNAKFQTRVDRPFFIADNVYDNVPVNHHFSPGGLRASVARQVGQMIDYYVTGTHYLNRGHLAAKTDFVFAFGQRSTFHYVNCAPQWYGFNGGNWNTLEVNLRERINDAGYETVMYTGTYGVMQLRDQFGKLVDIYLSTDENNNPVIPVPLYFYKVVYSPSLGLGTAFVGINNPHYTLREAKELFFCKDLCRGNGDFSWLPWSPDDPLQGYAFCCTIPDFSNTVHHLPNIEVHGLLT